MVTSQETGQDLWVMRGQVVECRGKSSPWLGATVPKAGFSCGCTSVSHLTQWRIVGSSAREAVCGQWPVQMDPIWLQQHHRVLGGNSLWRVHKTAGTPGTRICSEPASGLPSSVWVGSGGALPRPQGPSVLSAV